MVQKGHVVKKHFNVLSRAQVKQIQEGALEVLEKTGVVFQDETALALLEEAGCLVDKERMRVRFPRSLVENNVKKCPRKFILKARNPKYDLELGGNKLYFSSWAGKDFLNLRTLERRPPTAQETVAAVRVLDYLDEAHWGGFLYATIQEEGVSGFFESPFRAAIRARNTEKASYIAGIHQAVEWSARIFEAAGSTPLVSIAGSPPLTFSKDQVDNLLYSARARLPLAPTIGLVAGATSPATLAGTLVQNCAEMLSVIALAQVLSPGLSIIVSDYSQPMDMRTGAVIQGGIERGLLGAAWCQIWRDYGIPCMTKMASDAKVPDYQCAMEKVMSVTLQALAGSNLINFMGGVYDELIFSPEVAIIDNDVAHMMGRTLEGIAVTGQSLAVDLICEVGPAPGHFLSKRHTRDMWKQEQLIPALADRLTYTEWVNQGREDIITKASEKFAEILSIHEPAPLSREQDREIDCILKAAKKYYEDKGLS